MVIKRNSSGGYSLVSLKTGKILGRFKTKQAAKNREKQIRFFKYERKR